MKIQLGRKRLTYQMQIVTDYTVEEEDPKTEEVTTPETSSVEGTK